MIKAVIDIGSNEPELHSFDHMIGFEMGASSVGIESGSIHMALEEQANYGGLKILLQQHLVNGYGDMQQLFLFMNEHYPNAWMCSKRAKKALEIYERLTLKQNDKAYVGDQEGNRNI